MAEQWQWDEEDNPRHLGCAGDGEMTFFHTLADEEVGVCLVCGSMDFDPEHPVPIFRNALIDGQEGRTDG